jgi:hypothetical protein
MSSPHLPAKTLDHIVDHLYETRDALKKCRLVSKSWIPRTRKHLFASISFHTIKQLESWKETFPDPSTSPAGYAEALFIDCPNAATVGSWIRSFSHVEHLYVGGHALDRSFSKSTTPLVPFHGFSSVIKSLRVDIPALPLSQVFNLILSFPLLKDLAVIIRSGISADNGEGEMPTATQPPTPPTLTGSLKLSLKRGMKSITRRLLSLPGGVHFRKLTLTCFSGEDLLLATALVERCSHSLESLDFTLDFHCMPSRYLHPLITYFCFQASWDRLRWTSRKRQNSRM